MGFHPTPKAAGQNASKDTMPSQANHTDAPYNPITDADAAHIARCVIEAGYKNDWIENSVRNVAGHFLASGYIKTAEVAVDQAAVLVGTMLKKYSVEQLARMCK